MRKRSLIIFVAIVVVVAAGWLAVGQLSKKMGTAPSPLEVSEVPTEVPTTEAPTAAEGAESVTANKVVKHISQSVSGTVKSISGQTMVLEEDGDTLSIKVAADATIVKVTLPSPTAPPEETEEAPTREEISLAQIKVGDKVDALLASQPDGSFLANDVTVLVEVE